MEGRETGIPKGLVGTSELRGVRGTGRLLVALLTAQSSQRNTFWVWLMLSQADALCGCGAMWRSIHPGDDTGKRQTGLHCRAKSGVEDEILWPPPTNIPAHQSHFQNLYLVRSISEAEATQLDSHIWFWLVNWRHLVWKSSQESKNAGSTIIFLISIANILI